VPEAIGVDSAGAAGASAPPIIEMGGHCPPKNPEENLYFFKWGYPFSNKTTWSF